MDVRRYEPVTLAAARRLRSSYYSLAQGKVLLELGEPVRKIAFDGAASTRSTSRPWTSPGK